MNGIYLGLFLNFP